MEIFGVQVAVEKFAEISTWVCLESAARLGAPCKLIEIRSRFATVYLLKVKMAQRLASETLV